MTPDAPTRAWPCATGSTSRRSTGSAGPGRRPSTATSWRAVTCPPLAIGPGETAIVPLPGVTAAIGALPPTSEAWLTTRWTPGRGPAVGASRHGARRPAGPAVAVGRAGRATDPGRRRDGAGRRGGPRRPRAAGPGRWPVAVACTRRTTTGSAASSAAGADAGLDRLERREVTVERDGPRAAVTSVVRDRGRPPHRASSRRHGPRRRRDPRRGDRDHPARARRTCRASAPSSSSSPAWSGWEWAGTGPHETYPDRRRSGLHGRWAVDRGGRRDALRPAAGERRSRRCAVADPRGPARRAAASASSWASRARSPRPTIARPTSRRRPTTSTSSRGRRRSSTSTSRTGDSARPVAARHPRAVPRRARHVSLVLDAAGHPVTIEFRADERQFHLHDDTISLVLRVYEDGQLGHLHLGAPLPLGRSYRHLGPGPVPGLRRPTSATPVPMAYPTSGIGDFRVPAVVVRGADGTTTLRAPLPRAPDHGGQAGPARAALDVRRIRRRGRDARDHARRRAHRPRGGRPLHGVPRPPGHRPQRDAAQRGRPRPSRCGRR